MNKIFKIVFPNKNRYFVMQLAEVFTNPRIILIKKKNCQYNTAKRLTWSTWNKIFIIFDKYIWNQR